tara:strand:- start:1855 stop:1971 length:117 start_codon:yes stop_codon:yes gene_type:complete
VHQRFPVQEGTFGTALYDTFKSFMTFDARDDNSAEVDL